MCTVWSKYHLSFVDIEKNVKLREERGDSSLDSQMDIANSLPWGAYSLNIIKQMCTEILFELFPCIIYQE